MLNELNDAGAGYQRNSRNRALIVLEHGYDPVCMSFSPSRAKNDIHIEIKYHAVAGYTCVLSSLRFVARDRSICYVTPKSAAPLITLLALMLLALPNAALAASFTLTPATPSVAAGKTIYFTGSGFTRDEQVAIWATAPDQTVISGDFEFASDTGDIEVGFNVPADAIGGRWSLTAYEVLN